MYNIQPTTKQDPVKVRKERRQAAQQFLYGDSAKMGFFDFLLVFTATFWYFFWTGMAIILRRKIPTKWISMGYAIRGGSVVENMKEHVLENEGKKSTTIKVATINDSKPMIDLSK